MPLRRAARLFRNADSHLQRRGPAQGLCGDDGAAGLKPSFVELSDVDHWNFEAIAYDTARAALRGSGFPSRTLLCACDRIAFGVIAAISESGASVGIGRDYRVAGHDNQPLSAYTSPPLTTVAQDVERMSRAAFELLIEKMDEADGVVRPGRKRAQRALLERRAGVAPVGVTGAAAPLIRRPSA